MDLIKVIEIGNWSILKKKVAIIQTGINLTTDLAGYEPIKITIRTDDGNTFYYLNHIGYFTIVDETMIKVHIHSIDENLLSQFKGENVKKLSYEIRGI